MKRKKLLPIFLIILSLIGLLATIYLILTSDTLDIREEAAGGRTVTVCSSGCDFTDINQAFSSAQDNDTILLDTSEYDGGGVLSRGSGWDLKLPDSVSTLTIKGNGKDQTTWKLSSSSPMGHILHIEYLSSVTINIQDLTFDQNSKSNSMIHIYGTDTDGNSDDNANSDCMFNFENINVLNSKAAGIYISGDNGATVKNSYFSANEWPGVSIHGYSEIEIYNSVFVEHIHSGIDAKGDSSLIVVNNIIQNNNGGIIFYDNSLINQLKNNIIVNNTSTDQIAGLHADESFTGTIDSLDYNDVYNNSIDYNGITKGSNDISSDPLYVSDSNFHLQSSSPCIDRGDPSSEFNDLDGSRNDMGIYGGPYATSAGTSPASYIIDYRSLDIDLIPQIYLDVAREYDIVFNHKSVGNNILDGLRELENQDSTRYSISIVEEPSAEWYDSNNGTGEFEVGSNSDPSSKITEFSSLITSGYGDHIDIAFMKLCYVDNTSTSDTIWNEYKSMMENLESSYPDVTFVWWTMPIRTEGDEIRDNFNQLVRDYITNHNNSSQDKKFLYDIASIESHDPNGQAVKDGSYEAMYDAYTNDGGHLNETGQERAARAWWMLLAKIAGYETDDDYEPQSACSNADMWGRNGESDGIVNMFDLSKVLGKWKTDSSLEDISGPDRSPDGIVNLWDVIKITQTCWKVEV